MVITEGNENLRTSITIGGEVLEAVGRYKYLVSVVSQDGRCVVEVNIRVAIAKNAFIKIKPMLTNRVMSISVLIRFFKAYVWSTLCLDVRLGQLTKKWKEKLKQRRSDSSEGC